MSDPEHVKTSELHRLATATAQNLATGLSYALSLQAALNAYDQDPVTDNWVKLRRLVRLTRAEVHAADVATEDARTELLDLRPPVEARS